jgi:hypothetical protein
MRSADRLKWSCDLDRGAKSPVRPGGGAAAMEEAE